ncbi:MAG: LptF/LptG family permease [Paludibacteraceae bacterium]|nr:LptF/LptG family permease [Paludibacteraceae bacterium]MBP6283790.1 LptF/LptG family permease [Paludibacteraceae bacterium]
MLKKLDIYIIKKFLGTYFLSILLIMSIAIVIDVTEKIDDFYAADLDLSTILFDYYINFIPYYMNLFSSLFTFISVIFVTSKLAFNSEIIAMLASGISLKRILLPYFVAATVIALFTFYIGGYIIPPGNKVRYEFEQLHIDRKPIEQTIRNIQLKVDPNKIAYMERFELTDNMGYRFSLDVFEGKTLISHTTSNTIQWDSASMWTLGNFTKRDFIDLKEELSIGEKMSMEINMKPSDFGWLKNQYEHLTTPALKKHIEEQSKRGTVGLSLYKLEYAKRYAMPFAAFVLTLIGVSLGSRKVRGGTGLHIMIGFLLSVTYILATMISASLTVKAGFNPAVAIWTPNVFYFIIGLYLYKIAPK